MKEDTKKLIVLGGLGAVGIYFLTRDSEAAAGFGGGGGIPLLPGDTEGAAEGDTVINYLLGGELSSPFSGFDVVEPTKKEGRELLTKEALERGQTIDWDVEMPPTGAELMKKDAIAEPSLIPDVISDTVGGVVEWLGGTSTEKGLGIREFALGGLKTSFSQYTDIQAEKFDFYGGLAGRKTGAVETLKKYRQFKAVKAARTSIERESAARGQTTVWDISGKKRTLTPGQRSIQRESEARGQTVVYD